MLTGALALTLITGSGAAAAVAVPSAVSAAEAGRSTPFTDISPGHWAEKHIAKLALQGIITGYSNSVDGTFTFKPDQSIKQQEAVLMALRFAGLIDHVDTSAMVVFDESFVVGQFYKPYIELAFTEGLLDRDQEYAIASADTSEEWGSRPASREWVTKLIIKAIGEEAAAVRLQNTESAFQDADQIDDKYVGYVNAAAQMELVKGVTAVKFAPKSNINRASLATLFSRAQSKYPVEYAGQTSGVISKLTDNEITVYSNNQEKTYLLTDDTLYYHYNMETPVTKDQLLEYGDIMIIAKDGEAQYIEVQGEVQHTTAVTGVFDRYNSTDRLIYMWVNDDIIKVPYNDSIVVEDSDGKALLVSDLKRDTQISIIQDTFRETPVALKIVASAAPTVTTIKGELLSVDGKLIAIQENGKPVSKFLATNTVVEIEGIAGATIGDLISYSDEVELSLNADDAVTKVKVLNRKVNVLAGVQVIDYSEDKKLITIDDITGKNAQALYFTDKTKFDIMGLSIDRQTAMNYLKQNVNVIISYTHKDIVAVKFVTSYSGSLVQLNTADKQITLAMNDGTNVTLPYNTAPVEMKSKAIGSVLDLRQGDMLTLTLHLNKVEASLIKVHQTIQYDIVSIDLTNKKLKLKNATTAQFDQLVGDIELLNESGAKLTLSQLKAGSKIDATFVGSALTKIQTVSTASNG